MNGGTGADRQLNFLVTEKPLFRGWAGAIGALASGRAPRIVGWLTFFDRSPMRLQQPQRYSTMSTSLLVHFAFFFFLLRIPWAQLLAEQNQVELPLPTEDQELIYPLPPRKVEIPSPPKSALKAEHHEGKQPSGSDAERSAGSGVKTPQPMPQFALVLKPPRPDNNHQTIIQAGTPPDVRITHDVPLPNVLLSGVVENNPKIPLTGSAPKPVANPAAGSPSMNVPQPVIPDMALAVQIPTDKQPLLASPEVVLPVPAPQQNLGSVFASKRQNNSAQSGRGLLVLGANPSPPTDMMSVPAGNRYGEFSVSLLGAKAGVPSGPGGPAMGGGGTLNVRPGRSAGPGAGLGAVSVSGDIGGAATNGASAMAAFGPTTNGSGNEEGILPPWMVSSLVYPVDAKMKLPSINLIVAAGPIGGGGLGMFGVLSCSTIYTIYLPMPGKPWVLQYCQHNAPPPATPAPNGGRIHLGAGIAPPQPEEKYDFHRPPVDPYKRDKMIVLQGLLEKDGTIKGLRVFSGVSSLADQAAVAAFSQWKFRPAMDAGGKPIVVEMLIGIPATLP